MRISNAIVCSGLLLVFATSNSLNAPANSHQHVNESCLNFVQGFYDWYVPKTLKGNGGPAWDHALKEKPSAFESQLFQQLKEDSSAQAKAQSEIVGLDFDPFLNSQDPGERYLVGKVARTGGTYWVDVYEISSGKKSEKPIVVPEVALKGGRCTFVNFHYGKGNRPQHENLLSILKSLRESRQGQPK